MRFPRKRGAQSVMVRVFIPDNSVTTGAGCTGLTYASTNLAIAYSRELQNGGTEITGANLVDITTIGTWASPGTGKLGFKAVDAAKFPGLYEIHFPNDAAAFGTGDASQHVLINVYEKTTTALKIGPNMVLIPLSAMTVLDGESNVIQWLGTACHAATENGTPCVEVVRWGGQDVPATSINGVPKVDLLSILSTTLTQTGTQLADGFKQFFDVATPAGTINLIPANVTQWEGHAVAAHATGQEGVPKVDLTAILGHTLTQTGTQVADGFQSFFGVATPTGTVNSLPAAIPGASGGLPTVGATIPNAGAGDVGGLPILDADTCIPSKLGNVAHGGVAATLQANVTGNITGTLSTVTTLTNAPTGMALEATLTAIKGATWSATTDTLEAIRDRGDAAWITATGFSTLDAAGVRAAVGLATANLDTQLGNLAPASTALSSVTWTTALANTITNLGTMIEVIP